MRPELKPQSAGAQPGQGSPVRNPGWGGTKSHGGPGPGSPKPRERFPRAWGPRPGVPGYMRGGSHPLGKEKSPPEIGLAPKERAETISLGLPLRGLRSLLHKGGGKNNTGGQPERCIPLCLSFRGCLLVLYDHCMLCSCLSFTITPYLFSHYAQFTISITFFLPLIADIV